MLITLWPADGWNITWRFLVVGGWIKGGNFQCNSMYISCETQKNFLQSRRLLWDIHFVPEQGNPYLWSPKPFLSTMLYKQLPVQRLATKNYGQLLVTRNLLRFFSHTCVNKRQNSAKHVYKQKLKKIKQSFATQQVSVIAYKTSEWSANLRNVTLPSVSRDMILTETEKINNHFST